MSTATTEVLAEGKTKIIRTDPQSGTLVLVESKDDITAGDGARHDILPGKAKAATTTTVNVFRLLSLSGVIPTHFHGQENDTTFRARKARMIPIEVVVRRRAFGSYVKRNPNVIAGEILPYPVVEFYLKNDQLHDPLMEYRPEREQFWLYEAGRPTSPESRMGTVLLDKATPVLCLGVGDNESHEFIHGLMINQHHIDLMRVTAAYVFEILEKAWLRHDCTLVDLKVEFGFDCDGRLVLADVIDNDSWRLWRYGSPSDALDKQVFRDLKTDDPKYADKLLQVAENYKFVARMTESFGERR